MSKTEIPSIRFHGFEDAWEQRKLGELTVESTEYTTLSDTLPLLTSSRSGLMYQNEYRGNLTTNSKDTLFSVVPLGACTYRHMSDDDVFHLNVNTLEKGLVSREYPVFFTTADNDMDFIVQYINSSSSFRSFCSEQKKGGTRTRLYYKTLCEFSMSVPTIAEQRKISAVLLKLDHLITLHQRKFEKLTNVKKSMLEKMFPRNGSCYPEIRFKGFTDPWEQRKLSEMCGTFEYGLNAAAKEFDGKNKYIRITDIDDASREFLLSDLSSPDICLDGVSKYLLSSGDIVFARTGASVGKTYIYRENDGIVYFAGFLIRAKVNQDNDAEFVFQSTLSPSYEKYIRITSQRSGQPGVNAQEYGEYDLFAPSKEEQQRIGHFLRGIDHLITLHQRELEKLQSIKKALLEKMFV